MATEVQFLQLGSVELRLHPRAADGTCLIQGFVVRHQALVVADVETTTILAGQCCYTCAEYEAVEPAPEDCHGDRWHAAARASIERLYDTEPDVVHLSHDPNILRRTR